MSKIQLKSVDVNRLLKRFVGDHCRFEDGEVNYTNRDFRVHAKNIDVKTSAEIEAGGLQIRIRELRFTHEGADVDFDLD